MEKIKIKDLTLWIILAVFLRLAAMMIAVHGDSVSVNYSPSELAYKGILDIYRYKRDSVGMIGGWRSYYPPLTYFTVGFFQFISRPLNPGFYAWIHEIYPIGIRPWLVSNGVSFAFFKHLFFMKAPYLLFDTFCLASILGYIGDPRSKIRAFKLWSVNPVILYGVYMFGQADIIPALLTVLAVLAARRHKGPWALMLLSFATLFKTYPMFLILPLLITQSRSLRDYLKGTAAIVLPFFILLPFYFSSKFAVISSLFPKIYSEDSLSVDWIFPLKIIFMVLYAFLIGVCIRSKKRADTEIPALNLTMAVLMLLYVIFFVHVHYFIWVIPFLVIAVSTGVVSPRLYYVQIVCLFIFNLNSRNTSTALFMPLDPQFFYALPGLPDLMHNISIRWGAVMLAARMCFVVICVMMATDLLGVTAFIKRLPKWIGGNGR
ncbi:MAG: glycosyltransferase family 87 protein [Candidatus Omnitrophota bacterium]|nr:hypothetical protein [Candidatus Omnitrophota bacterium]